MKKWFLKNKDFLISTIIAGVVVFLICELLKLVGSSRNEILNFLINLLKTTIKIKLPIFGLLLFFVLIVFVYRVYNIIKIKNRGLKILEAQYGTTKRSIDITWELNNAVKDDKLKIVLSNNIAGDPHPGKRKKGKVKYKLDGRVYKKDYNEDDLIELS